MRLQEQVLALYRFSMLPDLLGQREQGTHERIVFGEELVLQPQRMQSAQPIGRCLVGERPDPGLQERAVQSEIDLGDPRDRRELPFVLEVVAPERPDGVEVAPLGSHEVVAGDEIGGRIVRVLRRHHCLVEAGREHVDQVDVAGELIMLLLRHRAGDEDAEMADRFMDGVDDGLSVRADIVEAVVEVRIQPRACCGGVILSPFEQKTMIGERISRRSSRVPAVVTISAVASLLPTKSSSTMNWISSALRSTWPPHQSSKPR